MKKLLIACGLCLMAVPAHAGWWWSAVEAPECDDPRVIETYQQMVSKALADKITWANVYNNEPRDPQEWEVALGNTRQFASYNEEIKTRYCIGEFKIGQRGDHASEKNEETARVYFNLFAPELAFLNGQVKYTVAITDDSENFYVQIVE